MYFYNHILKTTVEIKPNFINGELYTKVVITDPKTKEKTEYPLAENYNKYVLWCLKVHYMTEINPDLVKVFDNINNGA